jgi:hypothetical protein
MRERKKIGSPTSRISRGNPPKHWVMQRRDETSITGEFSREASENSRNKRVRYHSERLPLHLSGEVGGR